MGETHPHDNWLAAVMWGEESPSSWNEVPGR
jgi:hypothetical protein